MWPDVWRSLTPDQWQQAMQVMRAASRLPVAERTTAISSQLSAHPELQRWISALLNDFDLAIDAAKNQEVLTTAAQSSTHASLDGSTRVGPYRVMHRIGSGGMGSVYLAADDRMNRRVALKIIDSGRIPINERREQLMNEVRAVAWLKHPGIVTVYDVIEHAGQWVMVMEHVEGRSLSDVVAEGPLPAAFALRLVAQLAEALAYAHGRGVVHCDLKPGNIHLTGERTVKILDFGIAQIRSKPDPASGNGEWVFGTLGYLAPERLRRHPPTAAADIFALGVVAYQLLTGRHPFSQSTHGDTVLATITSTPPPPSQLMSAVPVGADVLVANCLAKDPRERIQATEVRRLALELVEPEPPPHADVPTPIAQHPLLRWTLGAMAVLAFVTFVGFTTSRVFDVSFGRTGVFDDEPAYMFPVWGLRSLVAPLSATAALALLLQLVVTVIAWVPILNRKTLDVWARIDRVPLPKLLGVILVLGTIALVAFATRFGPIVAAISSLADPSSSSPLTSLAPSAWADQYRLRIYLTLFLIVLGLVGIYTARRSARTGETIGALNGAVAVSLAFVAVLFWSVPWRLLYQSKFPRVSYDSDRCYVAGQHGSELLLFCPLTKRHLVVASDSPQLGQTGVRESPFTALDGQNASR